MQINDHYIFSGGCFTVSLMDNYVAGNVDAKNLT